MRKYPDTLPEEELLKILAAETESRDYPTPEGMFRELSFNEEDERFLEAFESFLALEEKERMHGEHLTKLLELFLLMWLLEGNEAEFSERGDRRACGNTRRS